MLSLKPLVLLAFASSVLAQTTPPAKPDLSTATPVASPNRSQLSSLSKPMTSTKASSTTVSAVTVVDSTGKTVGRALSNNDVLVPYNGQLMHAVVYSVADTLDWGGNSQFFYASSNCSGVPSMYSFFAGTRYIGNRVTDQSGTYMAIIDTTTATQQTVASSFYFDGVANQCYAYMQTIAVAPILTTVPISTFGTPPMMFK